MQNGEKKIVLIDDHVILRNGLKELIHKLGSFTVVHEFDNGQDFLNALPLTPQPDLFVVDLNMPMCDGTQVVEHLANAKNTVPVLILTLDDDEKTIVNLFRKGVRGYLKKDCTAQTLKRALHDIFERGYYHNEFLTLSLQSDTEKIEKRQENTVLAKLTPREREFLRHVCHEDEHTYKQIAANMGVNERTVDGYRDALFEKFGIKSKTGLVLFVLKHKIADVL